LNLFREQTKCKYVFDTSALIILVEKCELQNAFAKFALERDLFVPTRVREEFLAGNIRDCHIRTIETCFIPVNITLADELLPYFNFDSTSGEIWVISYALKNPSSVCVIDEEFGRNICRLFSIDVCGSIGIIDEMKKIGILSKSDLLDIRNKMRNARFYLSKTLCDELDKICLS
jgi:predicted nucleic acid-binding protein